MKWSEKDCWRQTLSEGSGKSRTKADRGWHPLMMALNHRSQDSSTNASTVSSIEQISFDMRKTIPLYHSGVLIHGNFGAQT